jgi:hypothetical protein
MPCAALGRGVVPWMYHGGDTGEVPCASLVFRSYSAHIPLILPLYTRANFSRPTLSRRASAVALTALMRRLLESEMFGLRSGFEVRGGGVGRDLRRVLAAGDDR